MDDVLYEEMYEIEEDHWWFRTRRAIVVSLIDKFLSRRGEGEAPWRVCDIGCGCGMMLVDLARKGAEVLGVDMNEQAVVHCGGRGVEAQVGALPDGLDLEEGTMDVVLMLHVVEHVPDDRAALQAAYRLLKSGGILICLVPAYQWLWSKRDEYNHHQRRYTVRRLAKALGSVDGPDILVASYVNGFLFPLLAAQCITWKLFPPSRASGQYRMPKHGLNAVWRSISAFDWWCWQRHLRLPYGFTALGVLRKPAV